MKRLFIFIIFLSLAFSSCYKDIDLNDYEEPTIVDKKPTAKKYFFYHNEKLFHNKQCCKLSGQLSSKTTNYEEYINRQCIIYNDTIYVKERYICPQNTIFYGLIKINDEVHNISFEIQ